MKITLNKVACYKNETSLETDKKVNLIYGLNGTGKSTISDFMYYKNPPNEDCKLEGFENADLLVYNKQFIKDNFYEKEGIDGVFTLSITNKEAEEKIKNANNNKKLLIESKEKIALEISKLDKDLSTKRERSEETIWKIKTSYCGGDRVLEYCLDGKKGSKNSLFEYLLNIQKPLNKPIKQIDDLKNDVESVQGDSLIRYVEFEPFVFGGNNIEKETIFSKEIIGNTSTTVSELILELKNSDWIKKGLDYLPQEINENKTKCPFCQQPINEIIVSNIKNYFDESYERDINALNELLVKYNDEIDIINNKDYYLQNQFIIEDKISFESKYDKMMSILKDNVRSIKNKIQSPSNKIQLKDSSFLIKEFNEYIATINSKIKEYNKRIDNRKEFLDTINKTFWNIMRWDYDQTIQSYKDEKVQIEERKSKLKEQKDECQKKIDDQNAIILSEQGKTVNLETARKNINNGLRDLGIEDFYIDNYEEHLYKIRRTDESCGDNKFNTFSEGEKMVISFLYFKELCNGKKKIDDISKERIIVIDDPISSLSHIYVFNIGQMIKNDFLRSDKYKAIFILTHSLYFFYELTNGAKSHKLFRIIKNNEGSKIIDMDYKEIQNDYHSYWSIIKDTNSSKALIANCMRNIIDYFFNFIEKKDLKEVFEKENLKNIKYQSFLRYINRESHSDGLNIFDIKEFDYDSYKEAFHLVFSLSGYEDHYNKMMSN